MTDSFDRGGRTDPRAPRSEPRPSARRKAEDRERELSRARKALAARDSVLAVVSHDLRDPLSAVVTSTALLEESCPPDGPTRRAVRTIRRSIDQMSRLIEDLQDAARLEEGRLSVEPAEVPVDQILDEVHQMFLPRAEERSLHLIREGSEEAEGAKVFADRARLVQVLSNLLGNSVRMTPAGGTIRFGAEPAPQPVSGRDAVRFFVADSGPGIPAEHLPHLFRPFWRAEGGSGGAGLGLAIARGIVEAHGGEIRAQNRGDSGALFSFEIPRP